MEEKQNIDIQLENSEIVPGEIVKPEPETKIDAPTREQLRNFKRANRRKNSKSARIANDIKMKKQAQALRKAKRKPSNFV